MSESRYKHQAPRLSSLPMASSASIVGLQTSAVGTNYVTFSSAPCDAVEIVNNTGTSIEYRRDGAGATIVIPNSTSRLIIAISNANEISLRRVDTSNTQVTVAAEILSV